MSSMYKNLYSNITIIGGIILILLFLSCNSEIQDQKSDTLFSLLDEDYTGVTFTNMVTENANRGVYYFDYFYNGAGVAIGDFNNDKLQDIYFTGNDVPNKLYINKGNLKFKDISRTANIESNKWSTGVTLVDINNDGWLDIYVCNSGAYPYPKSIKNQLFINKGDNTFIESAEEYGIADGSRSIQASFFDMDLDGDLDLWVMNHSLRLRGDSYNEWYQQAKNLNPEYFKMECSTLYRNEGNGKFTDISRSAGISQIGFGLGLTIRDFNEDGYLDVHVANDFLIPDFLFINNQDGTFTDRFKENFGHCPYYAMGADAGDINNDGLADLVVVDMTPGDHVRNKILMGSMDVLAFRYLTEYAMFPAQYMFNSLYMNRGAGKMSEIGLLAGVSQTDWSWAPLIEDFDNDGLKDVFVTNGYRKDTKNNDWRNELMRLKESKGVNYSPQDYFNHLQKADINPVPNQIFNNINGFEFKNTTNEWGIDTPSFSNGAAYGDLDNDGDLELVVNNFDQAAFIYKNNSREKTGRNYIQFKLLGDGISTSTLHSKVVLHHGDQIQVKDFVLTRGYQSSVEPLVHFGLGEKTSIDKAEIFWLDGTKTEFINPEINKLHIVDHNKVSKSKHTKNPTEPLFQDETDKYFTKPYFHQENSFDDFQNEILLPHKQSTLGPAVCVGDINNDGLEDFFIGAAKGFVGKIYIQNIDSHFEEIDFPDLIKDKDSEDLGALFFDIDQDNDLDLYVASGGGGDFESSSKELQDRVYINDGEGLFLKSYTTLPNHINSTQALSASDFDQDGDLDLFVGCRNTPGKYPIIGKSKIYENQGNKFVDKTSTLAPMLDNIGMVTAAIWIDFNNDKREDLVIAGEWMPITFLKNTTSGFENVTDDISIEQTNGWWYSLQKGDIDHDGDLDIIAGNVGLNNKFHPKAEKPLFLYANDFDNNGSLDVVLSKIYNGEKVPVRGKECSSQQMPFLKKKFETYTDFANASLSEIYEEKDLESAVQFKAYDFSSVYFENLGEGNFTKHILPIEAQLSPINGIISHDFNNDNKAELLIAGNMFQTEVETPRFDAGKGLYLQKEENQNWTIPFNSSHSGLNLDKDVKNIALIHLGANKKPGILVANNNDMLQLFTYKEE